MRWSCGHSLRRPIQSQASAPYSGPFSDPTPCHSKQSNCSVWHSVRQAGPIQQRCTTKKQQLTRVAASRPKALAMVSLRRGHLALALRVGAHRTLTKRGKEAPNAKFRVGDPQDGLATQGRDALATKNHVAKLRGTLPPQLHACSGITLSCTCGNPTERIALNWPSGMDKKE